MAPNDDEFLTEILPRPVFTQSAYLPSAWSCIIFSMRQEIVWPDGQKKPVHQIVYIRQFSGIAYRLFVMQLDFFFLMPVFGCVEPVNQYIYQV